MTSTLDGGGWSKRRPGRFTPGKVPPLYRSLGGPQGWSEKSHPPPGFDPRTVQPVASRYTDWAIAVHLTCTVQTKKLPVSWLYLTLVHSNTMETEETPVVRHPTILTKTDVTTIFIILCDLQCLSCCTIPDINLLKPTGHVMHQQFNIQQLYVLPTLYLCVLYLSENRQRLVPLTA